jgi:hypothetical protein
MGRAWQKSSVAADKAVAAASARLVLAAERRHRQRPISNDEGYYGTLTALEEVLDCVARTDGFDASVTRNHYGCRVLNAAHALFIDVDLYEPGGTDYPVHASDDGRDPWQRILDDIRVVLASEQQEGFRIYRTAAGYRILTTSREFEPRSIDAQRLMKAVGADADFVHLCRVQNSFRARLTPKPWRCGSRRPPNSFPRKSPNDERCFTDWLFQYERACRDRATCQYLEHVGPQYTAARIKPIIELHDCETKAFEPYPLA